MSDRAKQMFDQIKEMMPGLKNFGRDAGAEFHRLGVQGQMELASALFNGSAFVPYGPGQYTPSPEHTTEHTGGHAPQQQHEQSRER